MTVSMHTPRVRLAAAITGLASLTFVGAALAEQPPDPELAEAVTPVGCDEATDPVEGTDVEVDGSSDDTTDPTAVADDVEDAEGSEGTEGTEDGECEDPAGDVDAVAPEVAEVAEETDDPAPAVEPEGENHGAYVSEQARVTCWEPSEDFDNHGECVREAAHSDVGKPAKGEDADGDTLSVEGTDESVEDTEESVEGTDDEGDDVTSSATAPRGNAGGNGRGKR